MTLDGQTKEDDTVTIRDLDSLEQVRIGVESVNAWVRERLGG